MINKIKQRYFSNTNLYLLVAAVVMLVMLLSALSLASMVWGEDQAEVRLLSLSWQDVTAQINTQQKANKLIWLSWFAATLLLPALGGVLVSYLRREALYEIADQQALLRQSEQNCRRCISCRRCLFY